MTVTLKEHAFPPGRFGARPTEPRGAHNNALLQSAPAGARVSLSVTATGSRPLSYQWQHHGTNLTDNARINGSQYASLSFLSLLTNDTGSYQVIVTNAYGSVTSAVAVLAIAVPPLAPMGSVGMTNGVFTATFTNTPGATFTALSTTNSALPLSNWDVVGSVVEVVPGQFQLTDLQATNSPARYYRVRSP